MTELTYAQRCFKWASGHYLDDEIDDDFWELDTEDQEEYLEDNAWEPFESYRGKDIAQFIWQLANEAINKQIPIMEDN